MKKIVSLCLVLILALQLCGCDMLRDYVFDSHFRDPTPESTAPVESSGTTEPTDEPSLQPEPRVEDLVRVTDYIPSIRVDLRYSQLDNFTGKRIYEFSDVYLRYGTVKKLKVAVEALEKQGFGVKIWDGFRPVEAQGKLWKAYPDPTYVANPKTGYSSHSKGNTLDLTITDRNGRDMTMPTEFDDFSAMADRDYSDCSDEARENAMILQTAMEQAGFTGYDKEWWHYSDTDEYPVDEFFKPLFVHRRYAQCNEFINLRAYPDFAANGFLQILKNETFLVLAELEAFYYVEYQGYRGYVTKGYAVPIES